MSSELKIIKLFMEDRDTIQQYKDVFLKVPGLDRHIKTIVKTIDSYYEKYTLHTSVTLPDFETFFSYENPVHKDKELIMELVCSAQEERANVDLIKLELEKVTEQHYAGMIAGHITPIIEGSKFGTLSVIRDLIEEYEEKVGNVVAGSDLDPFYMSLADIAKSEVTDQDITWPLTRLNELIGGPARGTSGAIFARPDTGKTSFGINIACKFAACLKYKNLPGTILYLQNEEATKMPFLRAICSMCDVPKTTAYANTTQWENEFFSRGGDRLIMLGDMHHMSKVEAAIKRYEPRAVIIDQGPKVQIVGGNTMNDTTRLQKTYETFRRMSHKYNTGVCVLSQADAQSANKQWLGLGSMHASKTDVPGELDWAIGIGAKDEAGYEHVRYFYICKNKLKDGKHDRFTCRFVSENARFLDK